jgi:hypothetical protein
MGSRPPDWAEDEDQVLAEAASALQDLWTCFALLAAGLVLILAGRGVGPSAPAHLDAIGQVAAALLLSLFAINLVKAAWRLTFQLAVLRRAGGDLGRLVGMRAPSLRSLGEAFRFGLSVSAVVGLFVLLTHAAGRLPLAALVSVAFVVSVLATLATLQHRSAMLGRSRGFLVGFVLILLCLIALDQAVEMLGGPRGVAHHLAELVD